MERDDQLLRHIGRYHLSIRAAMEKLFFNGASSDHVLQRLLKDGRVQVVKGAIPGGLSYYQLSLSEARRLGIPDNRAREDKTRVLRRNLGILWFCCMSGHRRMRLDRSEYQRLGDGHGLASPHAAAHLGDESAVYRLYVPAPETKDERFVDSLRTDAFETVEHPRLSAWVARGTYRFATLVESPDRVAKLERLIRDRDFPKLNVHLEAVPSFDRLHLELAGS